MVWLMRIAIAYILFILAGLAVLDYLAHAERQLAYVVSSPDRQYRLVVYRDVPLPRFLGGHGRAPGEIEVRDSSNDLLDQTHIDDVTAMRMIRWEQYRVDVDVERDGKFSRTFLNLVP